MKYKNYRNSKTQDNRIYTNKDIKNMSLGEIFKRKDELLAQNRAIGVPKESELRGSDNVVYVHEYTREDGTQVKAHWRSKSSTGTVEVKQEISNMTKSAELQEQKIKDRKLDDVLKYPEQEYYKIAFELKGAREKGEIPEWIKEHNDIRTLNQVGNKYMAEIIKEKIICGAKDNNDMKTLKNPYNVYVVTAKPDSPITQSVENSPYLKKEIDNRAEDIKNGKYEQKSFSIAFPNSKTLMIGDINKNFSTHNVLGKCDICNVKIEPDGSYTATVVDYYDFSKNSTNPLAKNGYLQQKNGHLENYAIMIPIRIKKKK